MVHAGSEKIADKHRHLIALFGAGRVDPVKKFAEGRRELTGLMVGRVFRPRARLTRTAIRGRGGKQNAGARELKECGTPKDRVRRVLSGQLGAVPEGGGSE